MELHHLRYFVAVAEERHFGRAAKRLHVTQPPVSQRIRDLERKLDLELFERSHRGIQLTEAGTRLLTHARKVLREVDLTSLAMRQLSSGTGSQLRVGLPPDTSSTTIRVIFEEFAAMRPDEALQFNEMTTAEQLERLREGEIDVAVVRRPLDGVGLESSETVLSPLGVWLPEADPLANRDSVRLADLGDRSLVTFHRRMAPAIYDQILATCRDAGFLPSSLHHAQNPFFIRGIVESGLGVHLNNESLFEGHTAGLVFRPLEETSLAWRASVMWLPQRRTPTIDAFVQAALAGLHADGYRSSGESDF